MKHQDCLHCLRADLTALANFRAEALISLAADIVEIYNSPLSIMSLQYLIIFAVSLSHCILSCPLTGSLLILWTVGLVNVCNFRHQRVIRVGVSEQ